MNGWVIIASNLVCDCHLSQNTLVDDWVDQRNDVSNLVVNVQVFEKAFLCGPEHLYHVRHRVVRHHQWQ